MSQTGYALKREAAGKYGVTKPQKEFDADQHPIDLWYKKESAKKRYISCSFSLVILCA